jgi:transposase
VFEKFLAAKKGKKCPQRYSLSIYKKTKDSPKETKKKSYPTDLNDDQWELVKDLIPAAGRGGRKRTVDIRAVLNGIFYINAAVYAWRMLPHDFLVWQTVYGYFRHWRITKTWQEINAKLQQWYRVSEGREATQDVLTVNQLKLLVG